ASERKRPGWWRRRLVRSEARALNDIDIEIAVVVVIEEGDAGPQDLWIVIVTRCAVVVHEGEPGLLGAVGEPVGFGSGSNSIGRRFCRAARVGVIRSGRAGRNNSQRENQRRDADPPW